MATQNIDNLPPAYEVGGREQTPTLSRLPSYATVAPSTTSSSPSATPEFQILEEDASGAICVRQRESNKLFAATVQPSSASVLRVHKAGRSAVLAYISFEPRTVTMSLADDSCIVMSEVELKAKRVKVDESGRGRYWEAGPAAKNGPPASGPGPLRLVDSFGAVQAVFIPSDD